MSRGRTTVARVWKHHVGPVSGLIALFVAAGGPAWAASTINGALLKPSSVTSRAVKNASLTGLDVRNSSLTGVDVKDGTLDGLDVKDGSIAASDIAPGVIPSAPPFSIPDGAVTASKIARGAVTSTTLADGAITTEKFERSAMAPLASALPGLRTETNATSANVLGGFDGNDAEVGVVGATVSGGGAESFAQSVSDDYGTVSGGRGNSTGGATSDPTDAIGATVGGGEGNTASGSYATIPGGQKNSAAAFSMAAGRRAKAVNQGSFVWADSTNADFTSTADNQVAFRAANGVLIANDAGNAASVPVGTRFHDNAVVAWAQVTASGLLDTNFNVASITKIGTGHYKVTLASSLQSGFSLVPVVTPEVDEAAGNVPPTGAANVRFAVTNQFASGTNFDVYIYNGSFASVDNDFQFMVTGR